MKYLPHTLQLYFVVARFFILMNGCGITTSNSSSSVSHEERTGLGMTSSRDLEVGDEHEAVSVDDTEPSLSDELYSGIFHAEI